MACMKLYESLGAKHSNFMVFDSKGILYKGRTDVEEMKKDFCVDEKYKDYDLVKAMKDADVFIGLKCGQCGESGNGKKHGKKSDRICDGQS